MPVLASRVNCAIESVETSAYSIPTQTPESDGTLQWNATTLVCAEVHAGGATGFGYTYGDAAAASVIDTTLRNALIGKDAMQIRARWNDMYDAARNLGRGGIVSMAVSAVDVALWDLKGKLLDVPAFTLLGAARNAVPVYGSGGFTSYSPSQLAEQLGGWVAEGIPMVKMKVGRDRAADPQRVGTARRAIGENAQLFVDANGAYDVTTALELAAAFAESRVRWFEEPVFRENYAGTREVRRRSPAGMEIASGEYGYAPYDFGRMLDARCVDVLQADATRCGGFTGLLTVDGLCEAQQVPLSTHCAPYVHLHAAMACRTLRHSEYFFDHVRIERMLFDGPQPPLDGTLRPDPGRPGIGLELKRSDAQRYAL